MKELKRDIPAIVVKLALDDTEEVQVFWFRIFTEFGKRRNMGFINWAVFFCPKCDIRLEASCPLVDIAFNLQKIQENKLELIS